MEINQLKSRPFEKKWEGVSQFCLMLWCSFIFSDKFVWLHSCLLLRSNTIHDNGVLLDPGCFILTLTDAPKTCSETVRNPGLWGLWSSGHGLCPSSVLIHASHLWIHHEAFLAEVFALLSLSAQIPVSPMHRWLKREPPQLRLARFLTL